MSGNKNGARVFVRPVIWGNFFRLSANGSYPRPKKNARQVGIVFLQAPHLKMFETLRPSISLLESGSLRE
jgi:hypothetical protein